MGLIHTRNANVNYVLMTFKNETCRHANQGTVVVVFDGQSLHFSLTL